MLRKKLSVLLFLSGALTGIAAVADGSSVMVIMQEKVMGVFGTTGFEQPSQAETSLNDYFGTRGFRMIDPTTVKRNVTQAKGLRILEGDDMAAAALGLQHGARYSVVGKAISKTAGAKLYGTQMQSIQATATARLIRNDDARVLASASATASQAHIDEVLGGSMAIDKAVRQLAPQLLAQMEKSVRGNKDGVGQALAVTIGGLVSYRHLDFVMNFLENKVKGVTSVGLESFTSGTARLNIDYSSASAQLARTLANERFSGFRLEPTHVTPDRLDIKAVLQRR